MDSTDLLKNKSRPEAAAAEAAVGAAAARLDAVAALLLALEGTVVEETAEASGAIEEDTIAAATEGA